MFHHAALRLLFVRGAPDPAQRPHLLPAVLKGLLSQICRGRPYRTRPRPASPATLRAG
jgi:hypothetical protein